MRNGYKKSKGGGLKNIAIIAGVIVLIAMLIFLLVNIFNSIKLSQNNGVSNEEYEEPPADNPYEYIKLRLIN